MDNKDVMEVLKDGNVTEEDIIFESEVTEDSEETEIEEIIEIIEEVEEESDETPSDGDASDKNKSTNAKDIGMVERTKRNNKMIDKNIELYSFDEENSMFTSQFEKESTKNVKNNMQKTTKKQVINYDVDEDWQDEELERVDGLDNNSELTDNNRASSLRVQVDKKHINNQIIPLQSNRLDLKIHMESTGRVDKSRMDGDIGKVNNVEDDSESTQEIVKNTENNLLYTVLGTKKQDSSTKQQEKLSDHYVKVSISNHSKSFNKVNKQLYYFRWNDSKQILYRSRVLFTMREKTWRHCT